MQTQHSDYARKIFSQNQHQTKPWPKLELKFGPKAKSKPSTTRPISKNLIWQWPKLGFDIWQQSFLGLLAVICLLGLFFVFDKLFENINIHLPFLRGVRYFIVINAALLLGCFDFLKGIKNNVWEPTKRNQ